MCAGQRANESVSGRLSISKWIHLNDGDAGLRRFFARVFAVLRAGGAFVLEPQPWESYAKARRMDDVRVLPSLPHIHSHFSSRNSKNPRKASPSAQPSLKRCSPTSAFAPRATSGSSGREVRSSYFYHACCVCRDGGRSWPLIYRLQQAD